MKKVWVLSSFSLLTIFVAIAFGGCSKNDFVVRSNAGDTSTTPQIVSLYLSEGATYYDSVFVNIKSVSVLVDTCEKGSNLGGYYTKSDSLCSKWVTLSANAGTYNLVAFRSGLDTLLASGTSIPAGKIKIIKLVFGPNNSFVQGGTTYPLQLFAGDSAIGLIYLRGNEFETYAANSLRLWVNIDIVRSVVTSSHLFYLNPVLDYFILNTTGAISGAVLPYAAAPIVSIYNNTDTAYAIPNRNGIFSINGLSPGIYSVFVNASNGYRDTTINNITINAGNNTKIGTISLHQ